MVKMNTSSTDPSRGLKEVTDYVSGSPRNAVALFIIFPLLTIGFSYLVSWMTSPLKKFPGPPLACKSWGHVGDAALDSHPN